MRWLRRLRARIRYRHFNAELRDELRAHRELMEDDLAARGRSPDEARSQAARRMGNVTLQREEARRVWIAPWLEAVWQDLRYSARSLRKGPGFAVTAVLTLGLAVGLNVGLFDMFNALWLRPWDVARPGEIVLPWVRPVAGRPFTNRMPYVEYEHLRDNAQVLSGLAARERDLVRISYGEGSAPDYVQAYGVSGNFFDVLGIEMAAGRSFAPEESDLRASDAVAVISHGLWTRRFGRDPSVIGRTIRLGSEDLPVVVIGVARRGFTGVETTISHDLFVPLSLMGRIDLRRADEVADPYQRWVSVAGRLRPHASWAAAEAELDALVRQFDAALSRDSNGLILTGTRPIGRPGAGGQAELAVFAAYAAALLVVLLLACANVGNLQLARSLARRREIAVRLSLGAGRARVVRQMLSEAVLVSLGAAALGLVVAGFMPELVLRLTGDAGRVPQIFTVDRTVFAFAVALALSSAVLFALAPSLRATRATTVLAYDTRTGLDRDSHRLRSLLLGTQIALSLALLTGAGLLTRGILHVQTADLGFAAHDTAVARLRVPEELRTGADYLDPLVPELDAALRASRRWPVGWTEVDPLSDTRVMVPVRRADQPDTYYDRLVMARPMSAAAFAVLDLELIAGSPYADRPEARQAVINETLAESLWPGQGAVGHTLLADGEPYAVTGVVRDSYLSGVTAIHPVFHRAPNPTLDGLPGLVFRTDVPGAADELRSLVQGVDPRLDITVRPVVANIQRSLDDRRLAAGIAWAIGTLGLALATVGVFGVFAYAVEERRREIGVRLALGAGRRDVIAAMFVANRWSVGGGLTAGLLLSVCGGFVLRRYLFGLSPLDPVAHLGVALLLAVAAAVGTALPSRRAVRVDPAVTLGSE